MPKLIDCDLSTGTCPDCGYQTDRIWRKRNCPAKKGGVGWEFTKLTQQLNVPRKQGCKCAVIAAEMDRLGVEGCREHREELLAKLRENYQMYDWTDKLRAAWSAVTSGLAWELSVADPLGSLFDLAIQRPES